MSEEEKARNLADDPIESLRKLIGDTDIIARENQNAEKLVDSAFEKAEKCKEIGVAEYKKFGGGLK